MKSCTSWTRQESARSLCPKRFYLRYLCKEEIVTSFKKLVSVREFGGRIIHMLLADVIRQVADGSRVSDHDSATTEGLHTFMHLVRRCENLPAGILTDDVQFAEQHNGIDYRDEVRYWVDIIPLAIANGLRALHHFGVRSNSARYSVEAERGVSYWRNGREHRLVMDVLINEEGNLIVLDWKTHAVHDTDLKQVDYYLKYLSDIENVSPTRLYGFAVDLLHEQYHERKLSPVVFKRPISRLANPRSLLHSLDAGSKPSDAYPARPSAAACGICPFAAICSAAAIDVPGKNLSEGGCHG